MSRLADARVAYFSMEVALASYIPTYSGGLGVLAGDMLRAAADLRVPMVGVTLVRAYAYELKGATSDNIWVLLLDTDLPENSEYAQPKLDSGQRCDDGLATPRARLARGAAVSALAGDGHQLVDVGL